MRMSLAHTHSTVIHSMGGHTANSSFQRKMSAVGSSWLENEHCERAKLGNKTFIRV